MLYDPTQLPRPRPVATASRLRSVRRFAQLNRVDRRTRPRAAHTACVAKLPAAATLVAPHNVNSAACGRVLAYTDTGGTTAYVDAFWLPAALTPAELAFGLTCFTYSTPLHRVHVAVGRLLRRRLLPRDRDAVAAAINPMQPGGAWSLWMGNGTVILTRGRCGTRAAQPTGDPGSPDWVADEEHSGDDADEAPDDEDELGGQALLPGITAMFEEVQLSGNT